MPGRAAGVVALAMAGGCDPDLVTERGQIGLDVTGVVLPPDKDVQDGLAVLAGSELCFSLAQLETPNDYAESHDIHECYEIAWEGPVEPGADDTCRRLPEAGEVHWTATPSGCPGVGLPTDGLHLHVLDPSAVEPIWWTAMDEFLQYALVPANDEAFPVGWRPGPTEAARVFEAGTAAFVPGLVDSGGHRGVARADGPFVDVPPAADAGGLVLLHGWADGDFDPRLLLPEGAYEYTIRSVPRSTAASLELAGGYRENDDGSRDAAVVRAVVRDADGHPIYGGPVHWEAIHGWVVLNRSELGVPDGVIVGDCTPARSGPETHHATITASLWGLHDSIDLDLAAADDTPNAPCEGPDGPSGCGCTTGGSAGRPVWLAALLIGSGRRRKRRRQSRRNRPDKTSRPTGMEEGYFHPARPSSGSRATAGTRRSTGGG